MKTRAAARSSNQIRDITFGNENIQTRELWFDQATPDPSRPLAAAAMSRVGDPLRQEHVDGLGGGTQGGNSKVFALKWT